MRFSLVLFAVSIAPSPVSGSVVYSEQFGEPLGTSYPEWSSSGYINTGNATVPAGSGPQSITNVDSPNRAQRFLGEFGGRSSPLRLTTRSTSCAWMRPLA